MVRTQIQLPNELYARLKAEARHREMSLAELIRRASENYLESRAGTTTSISPDKPWEFPTLNLGPFLAPVEKWRELANPIRDPFNPGHDLPVSDDEY